MSRLEEEIVKNGMFVSKTQGDSMKPMLSDGDIVIIVKPEFPLKKYDIPVYKRDGHFVMHRIVRITKFGYVICGDNRVGLEKDITDSDIVGILDAYYHDGKFVNCTDTEYIRYSKKICRTYFFRKMKFRIRRIFPQLTSLFFR